jgi:hypothetical protein
MALLRTGLGVTLACPLLLAFPLAEAEEWASSTTFGTYAEFNDNPRLLSEGAEAVQGVVADLSLKMTRSTESSSLSLQPRAVARRYTGDYSLDSDDVYVNADYVLNSDRSQYSLGARFSRDGTLTSEFISTGFVEANVPREIYGLRGSASRSMNERMQLYGSLDYQDVGYVDGQRYGLVDYQYWSGLAYAQWSLNERTSLNVITRLAILDVAYTGAESREISVGLGLDRQWNDRWKSSFALGPTFSESDRRSNGANTSYRASLAGTWPRSSLAIEAERLLTPDAGRGTLETRDRASVSSRYRLTERVSADAFAAVDYYSDPDTPRNQGGGYRSFANAGGGLAWQAAPEWNLSIRYEFSRRDEFTTASANTVFVGVNWLGLQRSLSR